MPGWFLSRNTSLSAHVIQLLGKSADSKLVFEKLLDCRYVLPLYRSIGIYKRWTLHLISSLGILYSLGIVHEDIDTGNLLFTEKGGRLIIGDVEGRWGQRSAPEIRRGDILDARWME